MKTSQAILSIRTFSSLLCDTIFRPKPILKFMSPDITFQIYRQTRFHCIALETSSSNPVNLEYADLQLPKTNPEEVGTIRIRQHVNPLSAYFSFDAHVPDWNVVYRDANLPLTVDIGSGSGRYLLWLSKRNLNSGNYLGLEIRQKLVKRAEYWAKDLNLNNIHFLFANVMVSFDSVISTYPGSLKMVSILCPDPHFKKRHRKRRVVQKPLVDSVVNNLMTGGQVFIQSDVHDVAVDMRSQFEATSNGLEHIDTIDPTAGCDKEGWLLSNPMGIRTEREIHATSEGAQIYRRLYQKRI